MRLKEKFTGEFAKVGERSSKPRKKDGIVMTEVIYHPVINGEPTWWVFNPGSGRPLFRKTWVAKLGDKVSGEHQTRKDAIREISE